MTIHYNEIEKLSLADLLAVRNFEHTDIYLLAGNIDVNTATITQMQDALNTAIFQETKNRINKLIPYP